MPHVIDATQAELKELFDNQGEAIGSKDVDRLMSLYSSDVLYFDVVPPLRYAGSAALRARFKQWFDAFEGSMKVETRDFDIQANGDIAVAHWLSRVSGRLKGGRESGFWVRVTSCCQRSDRKWLITHEHVSLPVDVMNGQAAWALEP
jgi:ketosteroid isomerase-like protein